MKKLMGLMALTGFVALFGNARLAYSEAMSEPAENDGRILTISFVGERSSAVTLHSKMYEEGEGAKPAMILVESLKRKLAEKGFEHRHPDDSGQDTLHGYSVFIIDDAIFSKEDRALEKRAGNLVAIIVEKEKLTAVNAAPATGSELGFHDVETMADEIVKLLTIHSYI